MAARRGKAVAIVAAILAVAVAAPIAWRFGREEWEIRRLSSPFGAARRHAVERLAELESVRAVPYLLQAAWDRDLRETCIEALKRLGPEALPRLVRALDDPSENVRGYAALALAGLGPAAWSAVPRLIEALNADASWVRSAAADALGAIGPGARVALPALLETVLDGDAPRIGGAFLVTQRALDAILGDEAAPYVIRILADRSQPERLRAGAARALHWRRFAADPTDAVPALISVLEEPPRSAELKVFAAEALGWIGVRPEEAPRALPRLMGLLADLDMGVRSAALWGLGGLGRSAMPALDDLIDAVKTGDRSMRARACTAIEKIGPEATRAIPALVEAFKDGHVHESASSALVKIGAPAAPALAEIALAGGDRQVQNAAFLALGRMGASAAAATAALKQARRSADPWTREAATRALVEIIREPNELASVIAEALDDPKVEVEIGAAEAVAKLGPKAHCAVPALVQALGREDCDLWLRIALIDALSAIGPDAREALPALAAEIENPMGVVRVQAARALWKIGQASEPVVPALVEDLGSEDLWVRSFAADALGDMGPAAKASVADLRLLLDDSDKLVREAAAAALRSILGN